MMTLVSDKNKATAKLWPVCFEEERRKWRMSSPFSKLNLCMFQRALKCLWVFQITNTLNTPISWKRGWRRDGNVRRDREGALCNALLMRHYVRCVISKKKSTWMQNAKKNYQVLCHWVRKRLVPFLSEGDQLRSCYHRYLKMGKKCYLHWYLNKDMVIISR